MKLVLYVKPGGKSVFAFLVTLVFRMWLCPQARQELQMVREDRARSREREVSERARWQQEKEKVLRYQRQLQLACAHAQRTNRRLHSEIARLQGVGNREG